MILRSNFSAIKVIEASSGTEAIEIVKENLVRPTESFFDFIFMDLNMNVIDGYQATKEIKKLIKDYLKNKNIVFKKEIKAKIMLHTATAREMLGKEVVAVFDGEVNKPLDIGNLEKVLNMKRELGLDVSFEF